MNTKQLAEFYGISTQAVNRWDSAKRHRKTIQAEADVTPLEWQLVGEIAQLCYLYNAKNWHLENPTSTAFMSIGSFNICVSMYGECNPVAERLFSARVSSTAEMKLIKLQLEKLVYGDK